MSDDSNDIDDDASNADYTLARRGALGLLGAGIGSLALGSASADGDDKGGGGGANGKSGRPWHDWDADVDADGHALRDLGSLTTTANGTAITDFVGSNLSVDDGTLNAGGVPESIHFASDYPGDTLDQKINTIIEEVPSADPVLPPGQPGHRIVVSAPDPADPAALDVDGQETPIWRWEDPVVFDDNRGKIVLDMGWTLIFATEEFENFFVIGPDEKTENITINGGFFYARDRLQDSFIEIGNVGHCHLKELYLQSLEGTTPMGIHIGGGTEITVKGVEVTGCTNTLVAENVVDLDVFNHRGGGGENSVILDGCRGVKVDSVHTGSTEPQSVRNDLVRLENSNGPNRNVTITAVRSILQAFDHHAGVSAVDTTDGEGEKHRNITISGVDATGAEYGTVLDWAVDYDQQAVRPAPAKPDPEGVTRQYQDGTQSVRTRDSHAFETSDGPSFVVHEGDSEVIGPGDGIVLTTPDGEQQYRVRLDNEGSLVTEPVEDGGDDGE